MVCVTTRPATVQGIRFIELGIQVVNVTFSNFAGFEIKAPTIVVRLQAHIGQHVRELAVCCLCLGHGVSRATAIHDDPITSLPTVRYMQDVTGFTLEPAHILTLTKARNDAKTRRNVPVKRQYTQMMVLQYIEVMKKGQVVQYREVLGEADIMRQASTGQVNRHFVNDFSMGIGNPIGQVRRSVVIVEVQQLTRMPIHFRVRGHFLRLPALKSKRTSGCQRLGVKRHRIPRVVPETHQIPVQTQ